MKDFKVGDVVAIKEMNGNDVVRLLITHDILLTIKRVDGTQVYFNEIVSQAPIDMIRHATLKERYLRTGNVVKLKSGSFFIVIDNYTTNHSAWESNDNFNDDLTHKTNTGSDIVEVYEFIGTGNRIGTLDMMSQVYDGSLHNLIWGRKPKIELTKDEVVILKNIDEKYKYVARDKDKDLYGEDLFVFDKEPEKYNNLYNADKCDFFKSLIFFNHLFQNITFESGVHLISDLIKGNENE